MIQGTGFHIALLASPPDLTFTVNHDAAHVAEPSRGTTVATHWTIQGTHDGAAMFGPPSGKRVRILGISYYRLANGQIAEEWGVFDELSVSRQILLRTG